MLRIGVLSQPNLIARNAIFTLVGEGWVFVVLLVTMPALVAALGASSFGLFSLALVAIGYLSFLDIGVGRAATKFVSEHLARSEQFLVVRVVRTAIAANLGLGVIGGLGCFLMTGVAIRAFRVPPALSRDARLVLYAVAFSVPVLLLQGVFRAILSSLQRFAVINAIHIVSNTVQWGAAWWLAVRGYGVGIVVLGIVVVRMASMMVYGLMLLRSMPELATKSGWDLSTLVKLLHFGSWVSVSQIMSPVVVYIDRAFIAWFLSLTAVTLYTVPLEVITRLRIIPFSIVASLFPAFSERSGTPGESDTERLFSGTLRYLLLLLIPLAVFLLVAGPDALTLWMGSAFGQQSARVLQIMVVGSLFNCLAYVPYSALQAMGRPDITGKFHLLEIPIYICVCLLLIPHWGIVGAATAASLRFFLDATLLFWAARKYLVITGGLILSYLRILLLGALLSTAMFVGCSMLTQPRLRLALAVLIVAVHFLGTWFLLVAKDEKPMILQALNIFRHEPA